jgi:hypothetical protein
MPNLAKEWNKAAPLSEWDEAEPIGVSAPSISPPQEPYPMSDIMGASPWPVGQVPPAGVFARKAAPIVAGIGLGTLVPGVGGLIAGSLGATVTDMAVNPKDATTGQRETSFLTDIGAGLLPGAAKGAFSIAKKLVPAPLESRLTNIIKEGFNKGIRPTIVGKSNAAQAAKYYDKAQTAVESIVKNKQNLSFYDDAGNAVKGKLPGTLTEFAQSIDQTKRSTFNQYDAMLRASNDVGRTVDLNPVASEMSAFSSDQINLMTGGSGITRAKELEAVMSGKKLTLVQAQDLLANLNNRTKAYLRNPSPDQVSGYAVDLLAANNLRRALDTAVENSGYMGLRRDYGALREIEKEVSNRALVDARKNTKGLLDFTDIYTAAEMARAIGTMSPGGAATAGLMRGIKEYYKYLNNPNRAVKNMFSQADILIGRRPVRPPMKALPPGPRPMGPSVSDKSGITVTTGKPFDVTPSKDVVQEPTVGFLGMPRMAKPRSKTTSKALIGNPVYLNDKEWAMVKPFENGLGSFFTRDPKATRWDVRLQELVQEGKVQEAHNIDDLIEYLERHKRYLWNKNKF